MVFDSLWPHGLQPTRLLCPLDFSGENTAVSCHFLLQGIFLMWGWTCVSCTDRWLLYHWATREALSILFFYSHTSIALSPLPYKQGECATGILSLPQNPVGNMGSLLAFLACPKNLLGTWDFHWMNMGSFAEIGGIRVECSQSIAPGGSFCTVASGWRKKSQSSWYAE